MEDLNGKIYEEIIEGLMSKVPLGDKPSKLGAGPSGVSITIVTGEGEPDGDETIKPFPKKPMIKEEEEDELPPAAKKVI